LRKRFSFSTTVCRREEEVERERREQEELAKQRDQTRQEQVFNSFLKGQ